MGDVNTNFYIAVIVYAVIVVRWFYQINKYHQALLEQDGSYDMHKDHFVFKAILFMRAAVLAAIAPVVALFKPSYLSVFLGGIDIPRARKFIPRIVK